MTYTSHGNRSNFLLLLANSGIFQVYSCLFLKYPNFSLASLLFYFIYAFRSPNLRSPLSALRSTLTYKCRPVSRLVRWTQVSKRMAELKEGLDHMEMNKFKGKLVMTTLWKGITFNMNLFKSLYEGVNSPVSPPRMSSIEEFRISSSSLISSSSPDIKT